MCVFAFSLSQGHCEQVYTNIKNQGRERITRQFRAVSSVKDNRQRGATPEKSYRNSEIDGNLQASKASYPGLSYRMFLIGDIGCEGDQDKEFTKPFPLLIPHKRGGRLVSGHSWVSNPEKQGRGLRCTPHTEDKPGALLFCEDSFKQSS